MLTFSQTEITPGVGGHGVLIEIGDAFRCSRVEIFTTYQQCIDHIRAEAVGGGIMYNTSAGISGDPVEPVICSYPNAIVIDGQRSAIIAAETIGPAKHFSHSIIPDFHNTTKCSHPDSAIIRFPDSRDLPSFEEGILIAHIHDSIHQVCAAVNR